MHKWGETHFLVEARAEADRVFEGDVMDSLGKALILIAQQCSKYVRRPWDVLRDNAETRNGVVYSVCRKSKEDGSHQFGIEHNKCTTNSIHVSGTHLIRNNTSKDEIIGKKVYSHRYSFLMIERINLTNTYAIAAKTMTILENAQTTMLSSVSMLDSFLISVSHHSISTAASSAVMVRDALFFTANT